MIKIKLYKEDCVGCGRCTKGAPEIFEMEKDTAKLKIKTVEDDKFKFLLEIISNCPGDAIELTE